MPTKMAKNGQRPKTIWQSRTMPRNPSGQHLRHRWSKGCASVGVNEHLRGVVNEHLHDGVVNVHLHSVSVDEHMVHDVDVNEHLHDGVVNVHVHSVSVNEHMVHDVVVNEHLHACKRTA